ncbi:hypothetical protein [Bacteroides xylanisolvens]|uniref:hypothetical protein n=1 Tax=Bacteroides xylanisolvens TaxID=371601 RepID=UPI001787A37F|nr:hypothetical protein [Bacteroides xylanisolvens]
MYIVDACPVGVTEVTTPDAFSSGSRPHPGTAGPQRQPMRWTPLRTIAEVTPVLSGSGCRSSLAEYSKGSSTLCDGDPFG